MHCSYNMSDLELISYITEENERRKKRRIVLTELYFESVVLGLAYLSEQRPPRNIGSFSSDEQLYNYRKYLLKEMYHGSEVTCYDKLRLTKRNFHDLCALLRERCGLRDSVYIAVEEKVAMFLLVVGHGLKMRLLRGDYKRSLETISRHFSDVLTAILSLSAEFIKLPDPSIHPPDDYKWKWFGNALGALDGCHIDVCVPVVDQGRYRNRKQTISTNMLGVVDWNMKFLYVLPGWEGSASDSRVLRDAMSRQDGFVVPKGHYYLVDAGYTNGPGFLAPFRSTRYHLKEWVSSQQQPKTAKELYNLRHSRARNVVERSFGLLKKKWAILRTESFFDIKDQIGIINACCVLHNFARDRQHHMDDLLLQEIDAELAAMPNEPIDDANLITSVQVTDEWNFFRDQLAHNMFVDYLLRHDQLDISYTTLLME
ncbi:unnamed protein product [Urochloa decumbens]|uniref:DDE Tnp4 domain-containing protein n=1 Tax=Urochloa decumbens TaxID=240449 RepID=A0ABC9BYL8_9POAL